jgi:hypothetical protein
VSRNRYLALCALVLAGAFAGSYAANRGIPVAHAQVLPPTSTRATEFTLVNPQGQTLGTLRGGASGAELILDDVNGRQRVELSPSGGLVTRDAFGRVTWRSPKSMGTMPASASGE